VIRLLLERDANSGDSFGHLYRISGRIERKEPHGLSGSFERVDVKAEASATDKTENHANKSIASSSVENEKYIEWGVVRYRLGFYTNHT
jgi:hypothetical protein